MGLYIFLQSFHFHFLNLSAGGKASAEKDAMILQRMKYFVLSQRQQSIAKPVVPSEIPPDMLYYNVK